MDLRVVKTKKAIKDAFLTLRAKHPVNKIKVSEICELALINKSTFYKHYLDINDLADTLENEAIEELFENFPEKDCLISNPQKFFTSLPQALDKQKDLFKIMFKDKMHIFFQKTQLKLKKLYSPAHPTAQQEIALTFILAGALNTAILMKNHTKFSITEVTSHLSNLITLLKPELE